MKKFFALLVLTLLILGGAYLYLRIQWGPHGPGAVVYIPKGSSSAQIAQTLSQEGVVASPWSFEILVRLEKAERELKPGEYEFPPGVTAEEVLSKLRRGERLVRYLVIPEGYAFRQIAAAIAKAGIATESEVWAAFQDPRYLGRLGFPAQSLEGYLFPSTYEYDSRTTLEEILNQMVRTFREQFDPGLRDRAREAGWTLPQVVTLASVIEKETGVKGERPLIASVFENRLKIGMPLQSDPTIIYGLKDFDGNIRSADIRNPHPYNTYVHVGLPPTPIASPGKESLKAVLYPAQTDYLFFVAKGDGTHEFSATLEAHQRAVERYQLNPSPLSKGPPTKAPSTSTSP